MSRLFILLRVFSLQKFQLPGHWSIGFGLSLVLMAQFFPMLPIAGAMMLIGLGATQILATSNNRSQFLVLANLIVYASLGCFAIASQSHAAIHGSAGRISLGVWADHGVAILLLMVMAKQALAEPRFPMAMDR